MSWPEPSNRPLLILSVAYGYGGAERDIEILARSLAGRRKMIVFAANALHIQELEKIDAPGSRIVRVDVRAPDFPRFAALRLGLSYVLADPAAILANTFDSLRVLACAAKWIPGLDRRAHVFVRDYLWRFYEGLFDGLPEATLVVPDRTVLEKPGYVGRLCFPATGRRGVWLPSPVELPTRDPGEAGAHEAFLHLATVNEFKGHAQLIEAFALVKAVNASVRGVSYGHRPTPTLFAEIEGMARRASVEHVLTFHDHVADPSTLIERCRAVVVSSISQHGGPETFGRAVVEAWAHARPVIAFACGAPRRLIRDEIDGLLVPEGDSAALARAILRLHGDPDLATRMGRAGRERAEREFAAPVIVDQTVKLLEGGWRTPARFGEPDQRTPGPASSTAGRILFDVTQELLRGWSPSVGVSRITNDVARHLAARRLGPVVLVRSGASDGGFRRLTPLELEFLAQQSGVIAEAASCALAAGEPALAAPCAPAPAWRRIAVGVLALVAAPLRRKAYPPRWLSRFAGAAAARPRAPDGLDLRPGAGDVLICAANPWDWTEADAFVRLKQAGARVVLVVHDLMVWETPQLTSGPDAQAFARNMLATVEQADGVAAVSGATASVIARAFAEERRVLPKVVVARPAGAFDETSPAGPPPRGLKPGDNFVLFCSTIEVRKNHALLLKVWEQMRTTLPAERMPTLIFVGVWGWGADAVRLTVERNWRLAPYLRVIDDASDEELVWLYRNARFTVFPSYNEGYGLPVAESLAVGTPVLVSDHPATVEACEGLMPALDPDDVAGWRKEILRLVQDDSALADLRRRASLWRGPAPQALARAVVALAGLE